MVYDRIKEIGSGNFGEVWHEHDKVLNRPCAAKYLRLDGADARERLEEAINEARTMVSAAHDNVVELYSAEIEEFQGIPSAVLRMEFLPEGSLQSVCAQGPAPVADALRYVEDACRGVEYLHSNGVLHRDVKPGNLLLTKRGTVKVSDFGLSWDAADLRHAPQLVYTMHVPPECVSGGKIRSGVNSEVGDIYALGMTLYRLLNGDSWLTMPPDRETAIEKGSFPDRSSWQPHVHDRLQAVGKKALHKDPAKRYQRASDFRHALEGARPKVAWSVSTQTAWRGEDDAGRQLSIELSGADIIVHKLAHAGSSWRAVGKLSSTSKGHSQAAQRCQDLLRAIATDGF